MSLDNIDHKPQPEGCNRSIKQIGTGSPHPRNKASQSTLLQCLLYNQHTHRTQRDRYHQPYQHSSE